MSEALYGQNDVISSSYGAERKLCLDEARLSHLAHIAASEQGRVCGMKEKRRR
ncbi:hypothetical protein PAMP_006948 [Pampus punctatissimus]